MGAIAGLASTDGDSSIRVAHARGLSHSSSKVDLGLEERRIAPALEAFASAADSTDPAPPPEAPPQDDKIRKDQKRAAETPPEPSPTPTAIPRPPSLLENNTLVAFYGTPLAPGLGVLGLYAPDEMVARLKQQTAIYDDLNGERGAVATMDLIYSIVQDQPTANGLYLNYLPDHRVQEYIALAEQHDVQLILDLQIGRGNVLDEVRKIERFLLHPRVHVAIDPEYAVGPHGYPILTPGVISGHDINAVQAYLSILTAMNDLPPKMFVIHQFMDKTIIEGEVTQSHENVDVVLNMDAYGPKHEKDKKYRHFASRPYAERRSYNIFLKQDQPIASELEVLQLDPMPEMVMYQ